MEIDRRDFRGDEIEISKLILKTITLIKQNFVSLVLFLVGGVVAGLLFYTTKTPVYESSMLVSTGIVKTSIATSLVENFQDLIKEQNTKVISEKLNLGQAASTLKMIEAEEVEGKVDGGKTDIIKVIVRTTETSILPNLEHALIHSLEQNPYVQKRVALKKDNVEKEIAFLTKELNEISKLKTNIARIGENTGIGGTSFDLEDIYRQSMELFERKSQLTHELKTIENFQVIQGFTAFQKPISPKLSLSLAGGVVAGLILALLFIFFKELGKHLKTLEEQGE